MIYLCGDTHGTIDIDKVVKYFNRKDEKNLSGKHKYLIILGDTGICWDDGDLDGEIRHTLLSLPVTAVLFIDGNHENFELLNDYPVTTWNGGMVHEIEPGLIHLMRGQVFEIEGKTFFTFGGGCSRDKHMRIEGLNWWSEELPSKEEYGRGIETLEFYDFSVDYILTHTAPREVVYELGRDDDDYEAEVELRNYLQDIADNTNFKAWYFGHFHVDESIDDTFFCLMDEIVRLP